MTKTTICCLGLLAALLGCGGGGGGGGDDAVLAGPYTYIGSINQDLTPRLQTRWGSGDVTDGVSSISGVFNWGGLINSLDVSHLLTVDNAGALTLRSPSAPMAPPTALGWARMDGRLAACLEDADGAFLHMYLKRDGQGMQAADFAGDYFRITFGGISGNFGSVLYRETASGTGTSARTFGIGNFNGNANQLCVGGQDTYTVGEDGAMTLDVTGTRYTGQLTRDGTLGILSGGAQPQSTPELLFLLKGATSANDATFSGTYCMICYAYEPDPDRFTGAVGSFTPNGTGSYSYALRFNQGFGLGPVDTDTGTYEVGADGALDVWINNTDVEPFLRGAGSQDGDYAILWGANKDGEFVQVYLLFRAE